MMPWNRSGTKNAGQLCCPACNLYETEINYPRCCLSLGLGIKKAKLIDRDIVDQIVC